MTRGSSFTILVSACAIIATAAPVLGAVPLKVPLQGVIRDNAGVPVVEDVFSVTFSLYETAASEEAVWSESWPPAGQGCEDAPEGCVHVVEGRFQVDLGTHVPLEIGLLAGGTGLWLGMAVETDPELPRRPLGSAPYALHAQDAASASALDCSGCVALDMLGPGVVGDIVGEALEAVEDAGFAKHEGLVISEDNLPADGLSEVSNGLLTNEFTHLFSSAAPVAILDHSPAGISDVIQVADVGTVQALRVSVDLSNSDLSSVTVYLHDPNAETVTLFAKDGPGEHLVATYPHPDAPVAGDLGAWVGQNPQGAWTLEVVDDGYLNNAQDGQINGWSIQVDTLSAQEVAATGDVSVLGTLSVAHGASVAGDLEVGGTITGPGGIVVGASEAPCDADHAGAIRFDPESQRLTFCTGTELLQLKACSTDCPPPENTTCGLPVKNGCDGLCEGTGTALDPVQCLSKVSTTPCGETVLDGCDNSCNQTGTGLNVAACPGTDTVLCNAPVLDACGNVCGSTGTGYDAAQCPDAVTVLCASQVTDQCGNPCGAVGTLCSGSSVCGDSGCLDPGQGPENPGLSCLDVVAKGFGAGDGVYWIDPDGAAGDGAFPVWCDMTNGGWTLVLKLSDNDTSSFNYDSGQWSSSEPINSDSLDPDDNVTMKSQAYSTVSFTEIRMDMGSLGNSLNENISRDAARDLFTGGHVNSSYGRTDFFNWVGEHPNNWDTQPHCNVHGFNVTNSSAKCRYGISMNNEGDCNSNDSWVGLGCHHLSAGAVSWDPGATYARQAWVFVR